MKQIMNSNKIFPVSMAVLWSIVFANAMQNWGTGICMGLCMGIAFGLFDDENKEDSSEREKEDLSREDEKTE